MVRPAAVHVSRNTARLLLVAALILLRANSAGAQQDTAGVLSGLEARLEAQTVEIRALQERLDEAERLAALGPTYSSAKMRRLPLVAEVPAEGKPGGDSDHFHQLHFYSDYDGGFVIRPFDPDRHPFELKTNGWIQFRHHALARSVDSWTDNAGVTRPVRNRNAWDIERARLSFGGYALDPRLTYFLHLDGDTDGRHTLDAFDYWWAWKFGDHFRLQMGKRKVPASRQWLLGARQTRLADRPMANDFFRPDRTIGIFATGRIRQSWNYEIMVGNGYQTSNLPNSETDNRFTYAVTNYWDPLGDYGSQVVDYDCSSSPLVRLGHSFVYSPVAAEQPGVPLGEADFVRLTDGTQISQTGALAPGVTVSSGEIYFFGADAAFKWRGWSFNAELFLRWLEELEGDGPLPLDDLFQWGFYVEGGVFLIPRKLDFNARYSQVSGLFGDSSEYAAGFNWYPLDTHKTKVTFDVTSLDGSPLNNTASDILVGDDGVLFRTQFQAEF